MELFTLLDDHYGILNNLWNDKPTGRKGWKLIIINFKGHEGIPCEILIQISFYDAKIYFKIPLHGNR